jgi:hypothetical protein
MAPRAAQQLLLSGLTSPQWSHLVPAEALLHIRDAVGTHVQLREELCDGPSLPLPPLVPASDALPNCETF